MYTSVWAKYLPIIRIVLKRALVAEQILSLNASDFLRAGMTRKSGYKFLLKFRQGKIDNVIIDLPIASSLVTALLEDKSIKEILVNNEFHINMNAKFELTIKCVQKFEVAKEEIVAEEIA
jgi:hypothetical protein